MQPVAAKAFQSIDTHATQHILELQAPTTEEVSQPPGPDIRIYSLGQEKVAGADTPGTFAGVALLAKVSAYSDQSSGANINRISTKGDCFGHVATISDAARNHD